MVGGEEGRGVGEEAVVLEQTQDARLQGLHLSSTVPRSLRKEYLIFTVSEAVVTQVWSEAELQFEYHSAFLQSSHFDFIFLVHFSSWLRARRGSRREKGQALQSR